MTNDTAERDGPTLGAAIPYLAVHDARAAIQWYIDIFGAELSDDPIVMPDDRIGHAELRIGGGLIYLADAHPEIGVVAPESGAAAVSLMLPVDDADAVLQRAVAAGATSDREVYDGHGHRNAWLEDPFQHRWGLNSPLAPAAAAATTSESDRPAQGDIVYAWMQVPDAARAAAFYADVVGWQPRATGAGRFSAAWGLGIGGGAEAGGLFCCYLVDDLTAAADRVRVAGGRAGAPEQREYGLVADCVDHTGTDFALYQRPGGDDPQPGGPDSLTYLTIQVPDSGQFRTFYGAVLGWSFTAGRVEDGWEVAGSTPMIGFVGGHETARAVPMWEVADIDAAADRVRAAGGTATDPSQQPYGRMAECTDDQGTPFYLGQTR